MLRHLLRAAALALAISPAAAADWENFSPQFLGDVDVAAAYIMPDNDSDGFGFGGGATGVWKFGESNFHLQGSARYSGSSFDDNDNEIEHGHGTLTGFWRSPDAGLFGAYAGYNVLSVGKYDADYFRVGAQAQIYGSDIVTFSLRSGLFFGGDDVKNSSFDGYSLQGAVNFYLTDRFAAGAGGTFMEVDDANEDIVTMNARAEYLLPSAMPMSVIGAYNYSDMLDESSHSLIMGFKMYLGGGEGESLASVHRSGSADNGDPSVPLLGY